MTRPAKRTNKLQIQRTIKRQSWVLCVSLILIIVLDLLMNGRGLVLAKSFSCGALLSFFSQYIITQLTFKYAGYQARQRVVSQLYLGAVSRWVIGLIGFAIIFIFVKPLMPIMVILGYIWLQFSYLVLLWKV